MRKVSIKLDISLTMAVDEGKEISEVVSGLEYDFTDTTGSATIEDYQIMDFEVEDSK